MIVVTGATGTVGSALLEELGGAQPVRALVRARAGAEHVRRLGAEPVLGSFEDPESLNRALDGADRLFLLSPPPTPRSPRSPARRPRA